MLIITKVENDIQIVFLTYEEPRFSALANSFDASAIVNTLASIRSTTTVMGFRYTKQGSEKSQFFFAIDLILALYCPNNNSPLSQISCCSMTLLAKNESIIESSSRWRWTWLQYNHACHYMIAQELGPMAWVFGDIPYALTGHVIHLRYQLLFLIITAVSHSSNLCKYLQEYRLNY